MQSIISLFRTIFGYGAILSLLAPLIASILARRKGVKFSFELRLFEFYVYFAAIGQIVVVILAFSGIYHWSVFRLEAIVEILVFVYLLLNWMNFKRHYFKSVLLLAPVFIWGDYIFKSDFPDFIQWLEIIIFLALSLLISIKIDKHKIILSKEQSYIHIGIYLYSIINLIGITPIGRELWQFGHLISNFGTLVANYFYYRSFRCLYH